MVVAGVLGAAGPIAMAVSSLMPVLASLTGPIGLVILAVGAAAVAIFKFRDDIAGPLADVANFFITIYNEVAAVRVGLRMLDSVFGAVFEVISGALIDLFKAIGVVARALTSLLVDQDFEKAKKIYEEGVLQIGEGLIKRAADIGEDFSGAFDKAMRHRIETIDPLNMGSMVEFEELAELSMPAVNLDGITQHTAAVQENAKAQSDMVDVQESRIHQLGNLQQIQTDTAVNTLAAVEANKTLKGSYKDLSASLGPVMGRFKQLGMFAKDKLPAFFEGAFQALSQGTKSFGDFMLQTLQRLLVKAAALVATFAVLSIMMGGATGVAELTGGKAGLKFFMAGGMGIPQMASGGLFTGASLAMVGEGPGTSAINPEVVAPLDKLQQMMGGGNVTVTGMIRGNDILLSNERSLLDRNRVRGF